MIAFEDLRIISAKLRHPDLDVNYDVAFFKCIFYMTTHLWRLFTRSILKPQPF